MKVGKPQSKRVPVRLRHKIQKSSAAKQKKQRKDAKKNPQWRSRLKKDPGIPNLFPYKAKILAEVEENKRRKEQEAQRRRDVAAAQRNGSAATTVEQLGESGEDDILLDDGPDSNVENDEDVMDEQGDDNPMAALLASAQARAQTFPLEDATDEASEDDDGEWEGIEDSHPATAQAKQKAIPKRVLADPIKAVSALLDRMQRTTDGVQTLLDHYQLPPLMTANSNLTSSFLVEVARKRGRLGKGGVPNLHSAALTVLSDLNEERLVLPSDVTVPGPKAAAAGRTGGVHIVSQMAEPFRIEGLWGDDARGGVALQEQMVVET